jgi:arginine deiminase
MASVAASPLQTTPKGRTTESFGVHSEVGVLRSVIVCRPGLAHQRLTPGNRADLLFDDVLWVHEAQRDHYDFVLKMRERGVEVLDLHDLLAETLADTDARAWVLDRRITANDVGLIAAPILRAWLNEMPPAPLAEHLIGGIAILDVPRSEQSAMLASAYDGTDFIIPPIPNTLFQRDPSCWIYNGVTCNPMFWSARKPETLLQRAVYKFHPRFRDADFKVWWGDCDTPFGAATLEGGDVMPVGKGVVLIGMGERTTRQAVFQVAAQLFRHEAATRVIACLMPKSRAAMHLDTVFTFCDRDLCTSYREVADQIRCFSARPDGDGRVDVRPDSASLFDVVKQALGLKELRIVETGGNSWQALREQWDDGNNVVALSPGVVVGYDRNT